MVNKQESAQFRIAWGLLALNGLAILGFGLIATALPGSDNPSYLQANGVASMGMGLFGVMITAIPFARHERWAWWSMWYYPIFWIAHFFGGLPPGQDHIHQILFIFLSVAGLIISVREFFPRGVAQRG